MLEAVLTAGRKNATRHMRLFGSANVAAFVLLGALSVSVLDTGVPETEEPPSPSSAPPDSVEWARQEIVGIWESSDPGRKWVFTADGTLRKYWDGELMETVDYAIVSECKHLEITSGEYKPLGMIKEISADGKVTCNYVKNLKFVDDGGRPDPPLLLVGTRHRNIYFGTYTPPN